MNYVLLRCFLMTTFQSGRRPAWNRCVMTGWRPWTLTHLLDGALCHFITPDKITTSAILKPSTAISNSLQQRITMDMHEVLRSYSFVCQICLTRGEEKKAISHGDMCCVRDYWPTLYSLIRFFISICSSMIWGHQTNHFIMVWSSAQISDRRDASTFSWIYRASLSDDHEIDVWLKHLTDSMLSSSQVCEGKKTKQTSS